MYIQYTGGWDSATGIWESYRSWSTPYWSPPLQPACCSGHFHVIQCSRCCSLQCSMLTLYQSSSSACYLLLRASVLIKLVIYCSLQHALTMWGACRISVLYRLCRQQCCPPHSLHLFFAQSCTACTHTHHPYQCWVRLCVT